MTQPTTQNTFREIKITPQQLANLLGLAGINPDPDSALSTCIPTAPNREFTDELKKLGIVKNQQNSLFFDQDLYEALSAVANPACRFLTYGGAVGSAAVLNFYSARHPRECRLVLHSVGSDGTHRLCYFIDGDYLLRCLDGWIAFDLKSSGSDFYHALSLKSCLALFSAADTMREYAAQRLLKPHSAPQRCILTQQNILHKALRGLSAPADSRWLTSILVRCLPALTVMDDTKARAFVQQGIDELLRQSLLVAYDGDFLLHESTSPLQEAMNDLLTFAGISSQYKCEKGRRLARQLILLRSRKSLWMLSADHPLQANAQITLGTLHNHELPKLFSALLDAPRDFTVTFKLPQSNAVFETNKQTGSGSFNATNPSACPRCHCSINKEDRFCTACGCNILEASKSKFCIQCGAPLQAAARFCVGCGAPVS